jgi:hypothetical protein
VKVVAYITHAILSGNAIDKITKSALDELVVTDTIPLSPAAKQCGHARYMAEGRIQKPEDVDAAVIEGASARVRPLVMTVATTVLGLLPLLWEAGVGADVSARTAAPVVGGLWSCMLLTLLVLPAAYAMWRRHQVRAALCVSVPHDVAPEPGGAA